MNKEKDTRVTPSNPLREWALRTSNDTAWGARLARWIGKVLGEWQLRWKVGTPPAIPWTPLKRPLAEATVALVTTGGVHLCTDKPFVLKSDATFRAIPRTATSADLCITHEHYDRRDAARDLCLARRDDVLQEPGCNRVTEEAQTSVHDALLCRWW